MWRPFPHHTVGTASSVPFPQAAPFLLNPLLFLRSQRLYKTRPTTVCPLQLSKSAEGQGRRGGEVGGTKDKAEERVPVRSDSRLQVLP